MQKYKNILFDLDGTVNDSGPGIVKSVQYALDQMGWEKLPEEKLRKFVGPSLMDSFTHFCGMDEAQAKEAIRIYRTSYIDREAMFDLKVYDGIPQLMEKLREGGCRLALVTSKPQVLTDRIVDRFELRDYFDYIVGPEMSDPSSDKARLIRKAMERMNALPEETVMIGDTHFDMEGAVGAGIAAIGAAYGYGSVEELQQSGADILVHTPGEIKMWILGVE